MGDAPPSSKLFLVRHGETVDNVKGLYAGVRDSVLTVHGVQQAARLGDYFVKEGVVFSHIFSSDLSRAKKTAEAICSAQMNLSNDVSNLPLALLQEQDFGYYEGKPFYAKTYGSTQSGKDSHRESHKDDAGFKDVESKESMATRANEFLDIHLMPLLETTGDRSVTIAVVSHGMLLSTLWKCLLKRQGPGTVQIHQEILADQRPVSLEHIGGWSNTAYLELHLPIAAEQHSQAEVNGTPDIGTSSENVGAARHRQLQIVGINKKLHLSGLKRTRGGVGSAAYDEGQKSIDTFFKKQKR